MLPAPDLDDRRFQDLVDDAKRLVQRRCPEWTDHNVSDPGVTLIETFAFMTDQLLYRLNRVPDRLYVKFLELIGVRLLPPTPARAPVTFWLATPAVNVIPVPAGTEVATVRTDVDDAVLFATLDELRIIPSGLVRVATDHAGEDGTRQWEDRTELLHLSVPFAAFSPAPAPDDCLYVGLRAAVPHCAVALQVTCSVDGIGVDPDDPPLAWEAWTADGWAACDVDRDETGGLNRDGAVVLHVPPAHEASVLHGELGGWLRARVLAPEPGRPGYSDSPLIRACGAATIGGTTDAVHAEIVRDEAIGVSDGTAGQRFWTRRTPVLVGGAPVALESGGTSDRDGWREWAQVDHFADSGPDDAHYVFDAVSGEVALGPIVRRADGGSVHHGWVPPKGTTLRMRTYAVGGGQSGNVARRAISVLRTAIPYVSSVENREPARGGVDGETLDEAKARGPIALRTRSRAVTAEDYEHLAKRAAPEIARVRCVPAGEGADAGSVRVLVIPAVGGDAEALEFEQLLLDDDLLGKVRDELDATRLIGTRVLIEPPRYQGVTVVAAVTAGPRADGGRVERSCLAALHRFLHPLTGGAAGDGWPWGRPVQSGELHAVLQGVPGVEMVDAVRVFGANPVTRQRGPETQRLELDPASVVFSFDHQVRVVQR